MPLAPGTKLGRYDVVAFVGAGGMGEVHRARDTELGRDVALKVLRQAREGGDDARRRLTQEARTASALNHPNIATVHDVASVDGVHFIVMEYVAGRPLSAVIRAGLGLDEALRIAIAVADALSRAHAAGIVHRDLKPANVVVSDDGVPKVLDFGIAKLVDAAAAPQDDTTTEHTETAPRWPTSGFGGTPGYVAPEQVTGAKVDARSDIFSFGSMLYEMVTARRAFHGATAAETIGQVLGHQPPSPREVAPDLPVEIEQVILRCLRKEPERRFQSIADVKVVLQDIADARTRPIALAAPATAARESSWRLAGAAVAVAAVCAIALAFAWSRSSEPAEPLPAARLEPLTTSPGIESSATFSPDASQFAYAAEPRTSNPEGRPNFDLWVRLVDGADARRLTSDDTDELAPSWSPDGRWIAFLRGRVGEEPIVHVVSPLGGAARPLTTIRATRIETNWLRGAPASQIAWTPDSRYVVFSRGAEAGGTGGLQIVAVDGSAARALTTAAGPVLHRDPAVAPDGRRLAFAACGTTMYTPCDVHVLDLGPAFEPRPPARRLSEHDLSIVGLAWTRDGSGVVFGGARFDRAHLWRVPADGSAPPARMEIGRRGLSPAIAAAADRLAFTHSLYDTDVYAFQPGQPDAPVASSTMTDNSPTFAPDGRFAFESGRAGEANEIWVANADGSSPVQLTRGPGGWQGSPAWSPDGSHIAFDSRAPNGFADVWLIRPNGLDLRRITHGPFDEAMPFWSRDGRWIYYREDRADGADLWRVPLAGGEAERVTHDGGFRGVATPDGRSIVFTRTDDESPLFTLPAGGGPARQIVPCAITRSLASGPDGIYYMGCPAQAPTAHVYRAEPSTWATRLLGTATIEGGFVPGMAVSPDGRRILYTRRVAEGSDLMVVEHFR